MSGANQQRVLVIGATGMLGHKVWQLFRERFDAWAAVRDASVHAATGLFDGERVLSGVAVDRFETVAAAVGRVRPQVIVNCVGIVKQVKAAADPVPSITINSLYPHLALALAREHGARMIHISTDCVFAGTRGHYAESDVPDATDLYGRTKLLGEISGPGALTLRTSMIGRELAATTGLAEWFLSQRGGRAKGFRRAVFSGLTTAALARVLAEVIESHQALTGVYHVASAPINKYDLLIRLNDAFGAGVQVDADDALAIDRSLDGTRFAAATGIAVPGWDRMIDEMASDGTPYEQWRRSGSRKG
jgi:dTDP-4-dehydrorhamnose reductase